MKLAGLLSSFLHSRIVRRTVLCALVVTVFSSLCFAQTPPFTQCPPVGADTGCAILLVIDAAGSLRVHADPSQGPFDGIEDTLVGVQNNSNKAIDSIPLKAATPIFS